MNRSVLDALIYLYQHKLRLSPAVTSQDLYATLREVGFRETIAQRAVRWLHQVVSVSQRRRMPDDVGESAARVYSHIECDYLSSACRGFLYFIEEIGILTADMREVIIERLLALGLNSITLLQAKWVVLIVLSYVPNQEMAAHRIYDMVERSQVVAMH